MNIKEFPPQYLYVSREVKEVEHRQPGSLSVQAPHSHRNPETRFNLPEATGPGSGHHANEPPAPLGSAVQALALSLASPSFYRSRDHRLRALLVSDSQTLEVEPSDT